MAAIVCLILLVLCGIVSARMTRTSPLGCSFSGVNYRDGESIVTPVGTCRCSNAVVRCPPPEPPGCQYNGLPFVHKETFFIDGLKCVCEDGSVSCSRV